MEIGNYYIAPSEKSFRMFDNISKNQYQYHPQCETYFYSDYRYKISKENKCCICKKDLSTLDNVTSVSFPYPCKFGDKKHHCFLLVCSKECGDDLTRTPHTTIDGLKCKGCKNGFENLKKCGRCMKPMYCSKECQRKDWKIHKNKCFKRPDSSLIPPCKLAIQVSPDKIIEDIYMRLKNKMIK